MWQPHFKGDYKMEQVTSRIFVLDIGFSLFGTLGWSNSKRLLVLQNNNANCIPKGGIIVCVLTAEIKDNNCNGKSQRKDKKNLLWG